MPPDHMAAVAHIILDDAELRADWRAELDEMCGRIRQLRARLAVYDPRLAYIEHQNGMFSMLPLSPEQVWPAREAWLYMAGSAGSTSSAFPTRASTASPPRCWMRWMAEAPTRERKAKTVPDPDFDWREIAYLVHVSRAMDKPRKRPRPQP